MKPFVITIARGFGSGGKEIAEKLSKQMGIPWYERQILEFASEESGIGIGLFDELDEKLKNNKLITWMKARPREYVVEATDRRFIAEDNLFNIQAQVIRTLARTQSCIIVGKCANIVLGNFPNVVSVYIEAPRDSCRESVMNKMGVSAAEADRLISKTDKYRGDYYKYYTGKTDWRDPVAYDMTLNSARIGRDKCAQLIQNYVSIKFGSVKQEN